MLAGQSTSPLRKSQHLNPVLHETFAQDAVAVAETSERRLQRQSTFSCLKLNGNEHGQRRFRRSARMQVIRPIILRSMQYVRKADVLSSEVTHSDLIST